MGNQSYELNEEMFIEPFDDKFIVYVPTRKTALMADKCLAEAFDNLKRGLFSEADDSDGLMSGLLTTLGLSHSDTINPPEYITNFQGRPRPTALTLFLTTTCNLRCTYCCVSAGDRNAKLMEPETAYRGIDFIVENAMCNDVGSIHLGFVAAGEPTANWKTLTAAYTYAAEHAKTRNLRLVTGLKSNGVMSANKARWVVDKIDEIQISFDGLPFQGRSDRPTLSGSDSSPLVAKTLELFDSKEKAYKIRVTVPKHRISSMSGSIKYICENFRPRTIQIEPAYQMGRYESSPSSETIEFLQAIKLSTEIASKFHIPVLFGGTDIDSLSNHFCGISTDEFSLSAEGNVTACSTASTEDDPLAEHFFYGKHDGRNYSFDFNVLDALRSRTVEKRDFCQGCFAKWHCGGECHYKLVSLASAENFSGTERCRIVRDIVKDKLAKRIESRGGQIWIGRESMMGCNR